MSDGSVVAVGAPPSFRQQIARALEIDPELVQWVPTVAAGQELVAAGSETVAVVALSAAVKDPDTLGMAEFVARNSPATAVVVVRDRAPDGLMPLAMRAGVRDVVDLSRGSTELGDALQRAVSWSMTIRRAPTDVSAEPTKRGAIISVFSSKGGAGKTFLAANLAVALSQRSSDGVALVDLNLQMGDVFTHLGKSSAKGLEDLMSEGDNPDRQTMLSAGTDLGNGLFAYGAREDPGAENVSSAAIGKVLRGMRGHFEYVVVDTGGGYSDHVLATLDLSDVIYLIATLDVVSIRHLLVALDTLLSLGLPRDRFRFVLNRADSKVGLEVGEVERVTKLKVDAQIPSSRLVPTALNRGRPVVLEAPRSNVAASLFRLTDQLLNGQAVAQPARKRRLFARG
jgi:pilus assembly protein CpaE